MPATGTSNTSLEPHVPAWAGRTPYRTQYRLIHPLLQPRDGKDTGNFYHQDLTLTENTLCCLQPGGVDSGTGQDSTLRGKEAVESAIDGWS